MNQPNEPRPLERQAALAPPPAPGEDSSQLILPLACMQCGRQDETIRFVQIPYVISLLVITFRRAWVGVWCAKHRNLRTLAAAILTAGIGWLGIPYGLIYAPIALFDLTRSESRFGQINAGLLVALAEKMQGAGNYAGARKCLEAALQYQDDEEIRRKLTALRLRMPGDEPSGAGPKLLALAGLFAGVALTGVVVGAFDVLFSAGLYRITQGSDEFLLAVLIWVPLIGLLAGGGFLLLLLLEWSLARIDLRNKIGAAFMAVLAAAVLLYSVFQGSDWTAFALYFDWNTIAGPADLVVGLLYLLFVGGADWFLWMIADTSTIGVIYNLILLVAGGFYLFIALKISLRVAGWRMRLRNISNPL